MSAPIPAFPTRPDEVPDATTVAELLAAYQRHLFLAVSARAANDHDARHALAWRRSARTACSTSTK